MYASYELEEKAVKYYLHHLEKFGALIHHIMAVCGLNIAVLSCHYMAVL